MGMGREGGEVLIHGYGEGGRGGPNTWVWGGREGRS